MNELEYLLGIIIQEKIKVNLSSLELNLTNLNKGFEQFFLSQDPAYLDQIRNGILDFNLGLKPYRVKGLRRKQVLDLNLLLKD